MQRVKVGDDTLAVHEWPGRGPAAVLLAGHPRVRATLRRFLAS